MDSRAAARRAEHQDEPDADPQGAAAAGDGVAAPDADAAEPADVLGRAERERERAHAAACYAEGAGV
ncbi:hypothetical protein V498_08185 [Pseudogymnoascus sp. VKM F-4517 (FW-2822)]|nr:hypothetical protein V498_08185 [Pseudogymnoascus sp. VKM F-4517 (FW-2822)]